MQFIKIIWGLYGSPVFRFVKNMIFGDRLKSSLSSGLIIILLLGGYYLFKIKPDINRLKEDLAKEKVISNNFRAALFKQGNEVRKANDNLQACKLELAQERDINDKLNDKIIELQNIGTTDSDETADVIDVMSKKREDNKTDEKLDLIYKIIYKKLEGGGK